MRHDKTYNYTYLIEKVTNKYKQNTLKQNLRALSKDTYYITPFRLINIIVNKRSYFMQREISVISEALNLTDAELIKCFFVEE